jgi:hypothetical protein
MARSPAGRLITVAQTKRLGSKACRRAVAVAVAAVIGVHEDVGAALQFGIDAARRLELLSERIRNTRPHEIGAFPLEIG